MILMILTNPILRLALALVPICGGLYGLWRLFLAVIGVRYDP